MLKRIILIIFTSCQILRFVDSQIWAESRIRIFFHLCVKPNLVHESFYFHLQANPESRIRILLRASTESESRISNQKSYKIANLKIRLANLKIHKTMYNIFSKLRKPNVIIRYKYCSSLCKT